MAIESERLHNFKNHVREPALCETPRLVEADKAPNPAQRLTATANAVTVRLQNPALPPARSHLAPTHSPTIAPVPKSPTAPPRLAIAQLGPHRSVYFSPSDITFDRLARGAAQSVGAVLGKARENKVTASDLLAVEKMLASDHKSLSRISAAEIANLREKLPALKQILNGKIKHDADTPFLSYLFADAIHDYIPRTCAEFLASRYNDDGRRELDLKDVNDALRVLDETATGKTLEPAAGKDGYSQPGLAAKMLSYAKQHPGILTRESLNEIKFFMQTGLSDLASHGPMRWNGHELQTVFRLPVTPDLSIMTDAQLASESEPTPVGMEVDSASLDNISEDKIAAAIIKFEKQFESTMTDRIYLVGMDDGQLYVAVNKKGSIAHWGVPGQHASLGGEPGHPNQPAIVVNLETTAKSLFQATMAPVTNALHRFGKAIDSLAEDELDTTIDTGAQRIFEKVKEAKAGHSTAETSSSPSKATIASLAGAVALFGGPVVQAAHQFGNVPYWAGVIPAAMGVAGLAKAGGYLLAKHHQTMFPFHNIVGSPNFDPDKTH